MVTAIVRGVSIFAIFLLVALAALYFHPLLALWLVALTVLTYLRPRLGVAFLFVVISIDTAKPVFGGLIADYSELEFAAVFFAWLANVPDLQQLCWRPLLWGVPFLASVSVSGLLNLPWYKVPFHVARLSELIFAIFLVKNALPMTGNMVKSRSIDSVRARLESWKVSSRLGLIEWTIGFAAFLYIALAFFWYSPSGRGRAYSFFTNPNQFSAYLNFLLPFCLTLWLLVSRLRSRLLWTSLTLLVVMSILMTMSRGGIMAAAVSAAFLLGMIFRGRIMSPMRDPFGSLRMLLSSNGNVLICLLLVLLAFVALVQVDAPLSDAVSDSVRNLGDRFLRAGSDLRAKRLPLLKEAFEVWKEDLLIGVGPGQYTRRMRQHLEDAEEFENLSARVPAWPVHPHNLYLSLAINFGLVGLLTFLYLIWKVVAGCWASRADSLFALAGISLIVGFLVQNLFDVTFPSLALEMGFLIGFSLVAWAPDLASAQRP